VFEHTGECSRFEWRIEESEKRLNAFAETVEKRWLSEKNRSISVQKHGGPKEAAKKFKHKRSAEALQIFIKLNFLILDVRKVLFLPPS
jgi:hypothetical protein